MQPTGNSWVCALGEGCWVLVRGNRTTIIQQLSEARELVILNGWKEIAAHLGQGVRTIQRWEIIGLPIHRPRGGARTSVIAFTEELDVWSHAAPLRYCDEIAELKKKIGSLETEVKSLRLALEAERRPRRNAAGQRG